MSEQPTIRRHGLGVYSKFARRTSTWVFYCTYWWQGKRVTGCLGATTADAARVRAKELKRLAKYDPTFVPEHIAKKTTKEAAESEAIRRRPLLFEVAAKSFLDDCGDSYRTDNMPGYIQRLGRMFNGRYLDEITRRDVREYFIHRLERTGPFLGWKRKVGLRAPESEITALSAIYRYMQEEFDDLANPAHRPRGRRWKKYERPRRKPVIPTVDQVSEIFAATESEVFRALFILTYYTAARPQSESCAVRHGDVQLIESSKVASIDGGAALGTVTYGRTKTGVDRTVPVHPAAAEALRSVMRKRPGGGAALERWKRRPIFVKRGTRNEPMDRASYRRAWRNALNIVVADHPGLAGMVLRDLRNAAITHMREQGVDQSLAAKIAGHSAAMSDHYLQVTSSASQQAILSLGA